MNCLKYLLLFIILSSFQVVAQITIVKPYDRAVYQRKNNNTGTISLSGYLSNDVVSMEAKLVPVEGGQGVETAWKAVSVIPGSYSGKIEGFGGYYKLLLKARTALGKEYTNKVDHVGIGEIFLVAGQSNTMTEGPPAEENRTLAVNYAQWSPTEPTFIDLTKGPNKYIYPSVSVGSFMGPLGDLLVRRKNVPVLFMCAGAGGTSVGEWSGSSKTNTAPFYNMYLSLVTYCNEYGLRAILWHQGESNSIYNLTPAETYKRELQQVIGQSRASVNYQDLTWMVARASWSKLGFTGPSPDDQNKIEFRNETIKGQTLVSEQTNYVYAGPNTDVIEGYMNSENRPDGVHFSVNSQKWHAALWSDALSDYFFAASKPFIPGFSQSNTLSQNINIDPIGDKQLNSDSFYLNGFASSGLPITYSFVSGPATLSDNKVTLSGQEGTVTIQLSQLGDENFSAAIPINVSFNVTKNFQNISFQAIENKTVTSPSFGLNASSNSGLAIEYQLVSGPAAINGNMVTLTKSAGTVKIKAFQAGNSKYFPSNEVEVSFEVYKNIQEISFNKISNQFVDAPPIALQGSSSAGLPINFEIVSGPAKINNNKIVLQKTPGTVIVRASQAGNSEYNEAGKIEQIFNVIKYSQEITFPEIEKKTVMDTIFSITASSNSKLPVMFKVLSGDALVYGDKLLLTKKLEGKIEIEAFQAGDSLFYEAKPISHTIEIVRLNQTITSKKIESRVFSAAKIPISAKSNAGLLLQYKIIEGQASVTDSLITVNKPSKIAVVISQSGNNTYYAASADTLRFEVYKMIQTIEVTPITFKLSNNGPFEIIAKASSSLPLKYKLVEGLAELNENIVSLKGIGKVIIEISQAGDEFYSSASTKTEFLVYSLVPNEILINTQLTVYPNPASSQAIIKSKHNIIKAILFDLQGKFFEIKLNNYTTNCYVFPCENLTNGIYYLQIFTKDKNQHFLKLAIQH